MAEHGVEKRPRGRHKSADPVVAPPSIAPAPQPSPSRPVAATPHRPSLPAEPQVVASVPAPVATPETDDDVPESLRGLGQSVEDWEREEIDRCWLLERGPLTDDEWHHLMDIREELYRRSVKKLPAYIDMPEGWIPSHWRVSEDRSEGAIRCDEAPSKPPTP